MPASTVRPRNDFAQPHLQTPLDKKLRKFRRPPNKLRKTRRPPKSASRCTFDAVCLSAARTGQIQQPQLRLRQYSRPWLFNTTTSTSYELALSPRTRDYCGCTNKESQTNSNTGLLRPGGVGIMLPPPFANRPTAAMRIHVSRVQGRKPGIDVFLYFRLFFIFYICYFHVSRVQGIVLLIYFLKQQYYLFPHSIQA